MGGNAFTKAVADAFKLNFDKAEKLKRTAAMSKYARQIFQAMRPVFTDLASEIQRSLGFYTSSNTGVKLTKVIAMGGGTKMRGLLQYLQQTLQLPVEKPDSFLKLSLSSEVSAAKFHENVCDFGVVYGLGIQGLGLSKLGNNLLPRSIARSMMWTNKAKYFTIAACLLLGVSLLSLGRTVFDKIAYKGNEQTRQKVKSIVDSAMTAQNKVKTEQGKASSSEAIIQKAYEPFKYRDVIPLLQETILSVLPNEKNNPAQRELYEAFNSGDAKAVARVQRAQRKQVFVTGMSIYFSDNIAKAAFGEKSVQSDLEATAVGESSDDTEGIVAGSKYTSAPTVRSGGSGTTSAEGEAEAGFVVTITGYSPYKNIGELMDPIGVENDPNKWGVITRLLHLDRVIDGNSPFELFKKTEVSHFKLETGNVGIGEAMPAGVGVWVVRKEGTESDRVLIDPMTQEVISKEPEYDEYGKKKTDRGGNVKYKANDHWFRLDCKFKWKDAPKLAEGGQS
jgi:type IV pilus assembly protein PilM